MLASDMYNLLQTDWNDIDEYIKTELRDKFISCGNLTTNVYSSQIQRYFNKYGMTDKVQKRLEMLGYVVEYKCEDRPCAEPYLVVTIPEPK